MFRVGDVVECIKPGNTNLWSGGKYTVKNTNHLTNNSILVHGSHGVYHWYKPERFILIHRREIKDTIDMFDCSKKDKSNIPNLPVGTTFMIKGEVVQNRSDYSYAKVRLETGAHILVYKDDEKHLCDLEFPKIKLEENQVWEPKDKRKFIQDVIVRKFFIEPDGKTHVMVQYVQSRSTVCIDKTVLERTFKYKWPQPTEKT